MEKMSLRLSEDNTISVVYENGNEHKVNVHDFDGLDNNDIVESLTNETPFLIFVGGLGNTPLIVLKQGTDSDEVLQEYVSSEQELYTNSEVEYSQEDFDAIATNVIGIYEAELINN